MIRRLLCIWWPRLDLNDIESRTFRRHLIAALSEGVYFGCMSMAGFVLKKALSASDFQITLFFALQMSMFMFSSLGASFLTHKNHRTFILVAAFVGPLSLLSVLLCQKPYFLIVIIAWVHLVVAIYLPAQNMIFRTNYRKQSRGVCFARARMVALALSSVAAWAAGMILDWRSSAFPLIFGAAGLFGFLAYMTYRSMPEIETPAPTITNQRSFPYADFFSILSSDRFFRRYETYFFFYGVAFMMAFPMVPIFVNDSLHADWKQAAQVFGVIHPLVMIIFLPVFGRLLDRTSVVPVASVAFFSLGLWPLILAFTSSMKLVYLAYVFFGLGMAGVDVAWMLGANTFAPHDRIQSYMAIHVTLVGLRALLAPFLGLLVKQNFGFRAAFGLSGLLLIGASLLMVHLGRQCSRENAAC